MRDHQPIVWIVVAALCAGIAGCALPGAARRSWEKLKRGWDIDSQGARVVATGPASTVVAVGNLAVESVVPPDAPTIEPAVKWYRFYDGPMRPTDQVAILCHVDRSTHIATIRPIGEMTATDARHESWHYPGCIEAPAGEYELTVSYYSRWTRTEGLSAMTTTSESTTPSVVRWHAEADAIYVLTVAVGEPTPAPGSGPGYRVRPRTKQLWDSRFKLELSHWNVAIAKLTVRSQLDLPIEAYREAWQQYELSP